MHYCSLTHSDFSKSKFLRLGIRGPEVDAISLASFNSCTVSDDESYSDVKEIVVQERQAYVEQLRVFQEAFTEQNAVAAVALRETAEELEHEIVDRMTLMNRPVESIKGRHEAYLQQQATTAQPFAKLKALGTEYRAKAMQGIWNGKNEVQLEFSLSIYFYILHCSICLPSR